MKPCTTLIDAVPEVLTAFWHKYSSSGWFPKDKCPCIRAVLTVYLWLLPFKQLCFKLPAKKSQMFKQVTQAQDLLSLHKAYIQYPTAKYTWLTSKSTASGFATFTA